MSAAAAAPAYRVVADDAQWRRLVCASVYAVLNARDDLLPKAQRLPVDVCEGGLDPETVKLRADGPPQTEAFVQWLRARVVHDTPSSLLFEAALAASREEWRKLPASGEFTCAFSGCDSDVQLHQVTLFGNGPRSAPARTESVHVVSSGGWDEFVLGCVVVGGWWYKWLDDEVVLAIPPAARTMSEPEIDELARKLRPRMKALLHTAKCLYRQVQ